MFVVVGNGHGDLSSNSKRFGLLLWYFNRCRLFNAKSILRTIQFSISTLFSSIWPIDRTYSGATASDQSEPGSDVDKGVLRISQDSSITEASSLDCLESDRGHSLGESYPSIDMQVVYYTAPANKARILDEADSILHSSYSFGKRMNLTILPPSVSK